jgi:Tol biopolymer transport system component
VAFDWNGEKQDNYDIYVKLVSGGAPLRLTTNPAEDTFPAWSPDGSQIAFIRTGAGIYLISPLGGQERRLTDAHAHSVAWMPDGKSLLASIQETRASPYSIFQVSMSGEMRKVTSPPATGQVEVAGDRSPAVSPDGQTVAFERHANAAPDLYVSPVTGGEARRLTNDLRQMGGLLWINTREILFSSNRAGGQTLWRIAADGRSEPQRIPGVEGDASFPAIAYPAKSPARVAYQRTTLDYNIWRMGVSVPENGPARIVAASAPVIASTRTDTGPRFSPDGKRIAFASDRNGYMEIWVANSDGSNATQLTTLASRSASPSWSPDSEKIVFDSLASGNSDIWMISAEGRLPKRLTTNGADESKPSWSRDGRWIYFWSHRSGATQVWKIPSTEPYKPAVQVTQNGAYDAIESVDGKRLYFTKAQTGLWSLPVEGGQEALVLESVRTGWWEVTDKGVYFVSDRVIQFFSFANHKLIRIGEIAKPVNILRTSFSVSRDGRWIAWVQIDHQDSDLMLLKNFR